MSRLTPKQDTLRRLFALSRNCCAFPDCNNKIISNTGKLIGQVCHIEAANIGGERYNSLQSDEERRSFENLILLCYEHHVETNDVLAYPTELLQKIKNDHEISTTVDFILDPVTEERVFDEINNKMEKIYGVVTENNILIKDVSERTEETNEKVHEIYDFFKTSGFLNTARINDTNIGSEQLQFIIKLSSEGKHQTALDAALTFKTNHWHTLDEETKFKLQANIASVLFALGRQKEAAKYLLELKSVNYEKGETSAYLALAYSLLKDKHNFEEAFEKALEINDQSINLWIAFLYMQDEDKTVDEIQQNLPETILKNNEIQWAIGNMYIDKGLVDKGLKILADAIKNIKDEDTSKWQIRGIYASKVLAHILTAEKLTLERLTNTEEKQVIDAIDVLTQAWDEVRDTEASRSCWHMLLNRGTAYKALGKYEKAENDLIEANRISDKFEVVKNLLLLYIETKKLEKAEKLIEDVSKKNFDKHEKFDLVSIKARLATEKGDIDGAVETLLKELDNYYNNEKLRLLELVTLTYFEAGAFAKAEPFARKMMEEFPNKPEGFLAHGICLAHDDNSEMAIKSFDKAVENADNAIHKKILLFQVGLEYKVISAHEKAADVYKSIVNLSHYDQIFRHLILCEYHADNLNDCVSICLKAKELNAKDPTIDEVLFRCYDELGRYEEAIDVLKNHIQLSDNETHDHFRLLGIMMYKKIGQNDNAVELTLQLEKPEKFNLIQRMILAQILLEGKKHIEGFEMAYNARIDNYEDSSSHASYIQTLAIRPNKEENFSHPYQIHIDTGFILEDSKGKLEQYFLTSDNRVKGANIIRPSDSLGIKVLGKKIGDEIVMNNSVGTGNILTIRSIYSKYTFAFHDSEELLKSKYSDEEGFIFIQADNNLLMNFMKEHSIKADADKKEIYKIYSNDIGSIGTLAERLQTTQIQIWMELVGQSETPILSYTYDEYSNISDTVSNNKPVIIDCTALLTIFLLLNQPELIENLGLNLIVANSTILELYRYSEDIRRKGSGISVGVENGNLIPYERTEDDIEKQIQHISKIIDWCNSNTSVERPKRVSKTIGTIGDISNMIGTSSTDTILLAEQCGGSIVSDDEKFKKIARDLYGRTTFCSYQLITYNARKSLINNEDFINYYRLLIRAKYRYIPVTGEDLWTFFDESDYTFKNSFESAVAGLTIMKAEIAAAAIVAFAKKVYLNLSITSLRFNTLTYIVTSIKRHRDYQRIKQAIKKFSAFEFRLMPHQRNELMDILNSI